jgi:pyruvate/2-oxoglutarate/acetoin dehydrogenase E1 component
MGGDGNGNVLPVVKPKTVLESLQQGLKRAFADDERVILLGEDVLDPYGGAFKVTKGLSTLYPERVITTPISEAAIVGAAGGMALRGLCPIVEIMFGDFITLIADQVINHLTKFPFMYRQGVSVPLVIRTPMGGRRGYGATHSQSLEKLFLGVPQLRVLAPHTFGDPGELLYQAVRFTKSPLFFVEHKLLYPLPLFDSGTQLDLDLEVMDESEDLIKSGGFSAATLRVWIHGAPRPQVTLAAYGYMAEWRASYAYFGL